MTTVWEGAQEGDTKLRKKPFRIDFYVIEYKGFISSLEQWGMSRPLRQLFDYKDYFIIRV